jgi:hypothetical protein
MAKYETITHEYLLSILDYNPATGIFVWRKRTPDMFNDCGGRYTKERSCKTWNAKFAGKKAGYSNNIYVSIRINNILFSAHRLAWFYVYKKWPEKDLDHVDRNSLNNAIQNLREATKAQNNYNRETNKNNSTKYRGVCFDKERGKYISQIGFNNKSICLGRFDTPEEAYEEYKKAAKKLFGDFSCY